MACSSAMPGGGTNLELALHCLHEAQGDVQVRGWGTEEPSEAPALLGPGLLARAQRCLPGGWGLQP